MILEAHIAALATMSLTEKKAEWRRLYGKPAPAGFGAGLLTRALAYRLQEKTLGGLNKSTQRQLDQLLGKRERPKTEPVTLKPGTWLSRTWHGCHAN